MPEQPDEVAFQARERAKSLRRLDVAYGCYAYVGLFTLALMALLTLASKENLEGYAMGLGGLPALPLPIVLVTAIVQSARLRRNRGLAVLGLSTLVLVGVFAVVGITDCCEEGASEYASYAVLGLYGAVATLVPAWWFAKGRRRYRETALTGA